MGSGTFYNERRFLWEAVCFVWAVTGMSANQFAFMRAYRIRGARQAEPARKRTCRMRGVRAGQPAFMRAYRIRGARGFYGKSVCPIMSDGFYGERCALCKL